MKPINQPDNRIGYLLTQVSFLKQRITNAALKELGLTYIQFIILAAIFELEQDGDVVTQQDISTQRRLDKAMVSNVVKTLIEKGLMNREIHPVDKRAYTLSLTEKGKETNRQAKEVVLKVDDDFFIDIDKESFLKSLTILLNEK